MKRVCVIGAGASGLVTAKSLLEQGLKVVVYEQAARVGGTWVVQAPHDGRVFSSMYESLHTNLSRRVMSFSDTPFGEEDTQHGEDFAHHSAVLAYLERYAVKFGLSECIRFRHSVEQVEREENNTWKITVKDEETSARTTESFDAVSVCNGHYSEPYVPAHLALTAPDATHERPQVLHSHEYRSPSAFAQHKIVVVGSGASGLDIARELSTCDTVGPVTLSERHTTPQEQLEFAGVSTLTRKGPIASIERTKGTVHFEDGSSECNVDTVLLCTGYHYSFPFLAPSSLLLNDPHRPKHVQPLFRHLFHCRFPSLAFVGLCFKVVPFRVAEFQAQWVAHVWSGKDTLPSEEEMLQDDPVTSESAQDATAHMLGLEQFPYCNAIAQRLGIAPVPDDVVAGYKNARADRAREWGFSSAQ